MRQSFLFVLTLTFFQSAYSQTTIPDIGIWYSTWYSNEGHYIWGNTGTSYSKHLIGDMNGDGLSDAVLYQNGNWDVALSNGKVFTPQSNWRWGHGIGSSDVFLADVNGDGLDDAIVFFQSIGNFYVSINNGSSLNNYSLWGQGIGSQASKIMFADVNNDQKEDIIAYYPSDNIWNVALSDGSSFGSMNSWATMYGVASDFQAVGDVNGDGRGDAIVGNSSLGNFYVSLSTGNSFSSSSQWLSNDMANNTNYLVQDINNDQRADLIGFNNSSGNWTKALSSGTSFNSSRGWKKNKGGPSAKPFVATVDTTGLPSCIVHVPSSGEWKILPNDNYFYKPNIYNLWEAWEVKYVPLVNGVEKQYDSGDTSVIDVHLKMISDAGIDFLLLDETNNIYVDNGYIAQRARSVIKRIKLWNERNPNSKLYYAFAIGGVQFSNNVSTIENECQIVYNDFISDQSLGGSSTYYHYDDKPFIAVYYGKASNRNAWDTYTGSKTFSQNFDFRWMNGSKDPASSENQFPDVAYYPGWGLPQSGSQPNDSVMVAMPGWNNHRGAYVSRTLNGIEGDYYQKNCFDKILTTRPGMVIINSFNEFAEETGVEPANTSNVSGTTESWSDPYMYWNMTKQNLDKLNHICYKSGAGGLSKDSHIGISSLNNTKEFFMDNKQNGLLVLDSKNKGFVITQMQSPESTITDARDGMIVWDTDDNCIKLYVDNKWECIAQGCDQLSN